jgi:Protein of unknown function (DUF1566)
MIFFKNIRIMACYSQFIVIKFIDEVKMKLKRKVAHKAVLLAGFFFFLSICLVTPCQAAGKRFETLEDGTVKDQKSGLIWAPQDNGATIIWSEAVVYCDNYSFGGHNDWRMPSSEELATLYGNRPKVKGQDYEQAIDVITKSIQITAPWVWTGRRMPKNKAMAFGFNYGTSRRLYRGNGVNRRVLPVRSSR